MITSAISSAVEPRAFLITSSVIASLSAIGVHLDVAVLVEPHHAAGRYDAGRVGLVDEKRPGQLAVEQPCTIRRRRLQPSRVRTEVCGARSALRRERPN